MSLVFPDDLDAWKTWQQRRRPIRRVKQLVRTDALEPVIYVGGSRPSILIVAEGLSPSYRAAFLSCIDHLPMESLAILASPSSAIALPDHAWEVHTKEDIPTLKVILAAGHFTGLGHLAWQMSQQLSIPYFVAQHGLVTPFAPPLPPDAHLLAWSDQDGDYWWSGRGGRSTVVGAQILWTAGAVPADEIDAHAPLTYLGQLHGAELQHRPLARAAEFFCLRHGATYRPHPSETDRLSRWQHRRWERRGVVIDRTGVPVRDSASPVVSVFSTGVLEAAARGLPAWVDFPDPPSWLREFWERYDMRPYGADPTPAPPRPDVEPSAAVAEILRSHL